MRNEIYMGIYYEKIDYTGFTWGFIWGRVFYMGKPHVIKIYMVIYHTNLKLSRKMGKLSRGISRTIKSITTLFR